MNKQSWWKGFLSVWVILGGLGVSLVLIGLAAGGAFYMRATPAPVNSKPVISVIPAPTLTPVVEMPTSAAATPTAETAGEATAQAGTISIGTYVKISGTGGDGLRLRSGPGTNSDALFLGMDSEVFQVMDGPRQADGFTWWFLKAPYDKSRSGWAVSNYLTVVPKP